MTADDFFRKLIMLPSPSWHEEEAAAYIRKAMEGYGYFLKEDGHGNMLFYRSTEGEKLMFAAHMDTVDKAVSPAAVETEDCFMTDGTTALGADDKCAVAAMLASAAAGPDVLFLFTVAEERGLEGSAMISREFLQPFRIAAAFIFDIEGEVGRAASSAPGKAYIHLSFHGKSAHAGFEPEKGRSALLAAAAAALAIPSGRIDADTTANIGSIRSGGSINVVPDLAEMEAEARSSSMEKLEALMGEIISKAETAAARHGNTVESECRILYRPYSIDADALSMRLARESSAMIGRDFSASPTSGGSDANSLQALGIDAIVLSAGYIAPHSVSERIMKKELQALKEQIDALCSLA